VFSRFKLQTKSISPALFTEVSLWTLTGLNEIFKNVSMSATALHQIKEWKLE